MERQTKPLVSVVMSVYKEPIEWIESAIDSIINQTYPNLEIILIIDNPNYGQRKELYQYIKKCRNRTVKVIENQKNYGLVYSLNEGIKLSSGCLIARMDADDISNQNRILEEVNYLITSNSDIIGCYYQDMRENSISKINYTSYTDEACRKIIKYSNCICHPSWLVKKEVYDALNGYRNIDSCEDLDFLIRAVEKGFVIGNIPQPLFLYRTNPNSISHLKSVKQRLIGEYLRSNYRHHKPTSMDDIKSYCESRKYRKESKKLETIVDLSDKRKGYLVALVKNNLLIYMMKDTIRTKLRNAYIKCVIYFDLKNLHTKKRRS